jgi:hypothetical protein
MQPQLSEPDLVQGLLGPLQLSTILGAPGTGKTFLALDIALHVAAGLPWFGRRVKQGAVVYVAAEAGKRIYNRVHAWRLRHRPAREAPTLKPRSMAEKVRRNATRERGAAGPKMEAGQNMPFYCVPIQIDLCTADEDLDALIEAIRDACGDDSPVLIVVDTVSRVMAGGDENSSQDMGALIASADRLRDEFGANVCLVHHLGKDASRGARGHSSLKGAVDTEIEVSRDDDAKLSTARVAKQRDGETGEKIHFALDVVTIGENEETGEEVTSCVVVTPDAERLTRAKRPKLGRVEQIALNALECAIEAEGEVPPASANCPAEKWIREEQWRKKCHRDGISRGGARAIRIAFQRAREGLSSAGMIDAAGGFVWRC